MATSFTGKLLWLDDKANFVAKKHLIEFMAQFPEGTYFEIVVKPIGDVNAHAQSKLYHQWCDIFANELGWDSGQEVHAFFKTKFNNGESTKGFDTLQWSTLMTKVLSFAGEHNITLPKGNAD